MVKGIDVANFFIELMNSEKDGSVTNAQLNKLLFFSQAWSLVLNNEPLFEEDFQAWDYGPVLPSVYHQFKSYKKNNIENVTDENYLSKFTDKQGDLLLDVYRAYGEYTAPKLIKITHAKGGAWDQVYIQGENNIIPKELIKDYYSKQPKINQWKMPAFSEDDFVGYRNDKGILVLPADWNEDGDYWDEYAKKSGIL